MQGTDCKFDLDTSDGAEELGCLYTVTTSLKFTAKDTPRYGKKCYNALYCTIVQWARKVYAATLV
jgi:hypothetical protein